MARLLDDKATVAFGGVILFHLVTCRFVLQHILQLGQQSRAFSTLKIY